MNILCITNTGRIYGANTSLLDSLEELQHRNYNIYVVVMPKTEIKRELIKRGIKIYELDYAVNCSLNDNLNEKCLRLFKNIKCMKQLGEIIKCKQIDIIHTNGSNIDIGAMASIIYKIPHVWHIRERLWDHYKFKYDFPLLSYYLLRHSYKKIAISKYVAEQQHLSKNVVVIYNGFDIGKYSIAKEKHLSSSTLKILYCGEISHKKGILDIVKAIRYLVENNYETFELYIAGDKNQYWSRIVKYIKKHNLSDYIHYCGYQKDLRKIRNEADIAVMTSRNEGLGRVTIESMLSELLVIGADSGATSEIIQDGVTGILYEPGNIVQLAEIILQIKEKNDKFTKIIKQAKKYAKENFSCERYVDKLVSVYKEIV